MKKYHCLFPFHPFPKITHTTEQNDFTSEPDTQLYGEDREFDSKRQRQIRRLEKTIKKLHRAIQKLEDQEVDFDDEEDSVYLLTERCFSIVYLEFHVFKVIPEANNLSISECKNIFKL